MISMGMSPEDKKQYEKLLVSNHGVRILINIMKTDHTALGSVSDMFLDGQINMDTTQAITRSAPLTFLDPKHLMGVDSGNPSDGALYMDRMLSIYYGVYTPDWQTWFNIPVFCGPITKVDRDSAVVKVECKGKEIFGLGPTWKPKTYKKGAYKRDVIVDLLRWYMGETKYSIPASTSRLTSDVAMSSETKPWELAVEIAGSMNMQLIYDGRGIATVRPFPNGIGWEFSEFTGSGSILSKPQISYNTDNLVNAVQVVGSLTKGTKKVPLVVNKLADASHPLSPNALGRNGVPRYFFDLVKDENINSQAEALAVATSKLNSGLLQAVETSFDSLVIPHIDELEVYKLSTWEYSINAQLQKMTIPLTASGTSSIGYLKNIRTPNAATMNRNRR